MQFLSVSIFFLWAFWYKDPTSNNISILKHRNRLRSTLWEHKIYHVLSWEERLVCPTITYSFPLKWSFPSKVSAFKVTVKFYRQEFNKSVSYRGSCRSRTAPICNGTRSIWRSQYNYIPVINIRDINNRARSLFFMSLINMHDVISPHICQH